MSGDGDQDVTGARARHEVIVEPVKNGPALGGYGAVAMKEALTAMISTMPADLLRSLKFSHRLW